MNTLTRLNDDDTLHRDQSADINKIENNLGKATKIYVELDSTSRNQANTGQFSNQTLNTTLISNKVISNLNNENIAPSSTSTLSHEELFTSMEDTTSASV